jgi:hypothetical protein
MKVTFTLTLTLEAAQALDTLAQAKGTRPTTYASILLTEAIGAATPPSPESIRPAPKPKARP